MEDWLIILIVLIVLFVCIIVYKNRHLIINGFKSKIVRNNPESATQRIGQNEVKSAGRSIDEIANNTKIKINKDINFINKFFTNIDYQNLNINDKFLNDCIRLTDDINNKISYLMQELKLPLDIKVKKEKISNFYSNYIQVTNNKNSYYALDYSNTTGDSNKSYIKKQYNIYPEDEDNNPNLLKNTINNIENKFYKSKSAINLLEKLFDNNKNTYVTDSNIIQNAISEYYNIKYTQKEDSIGDVVLGFIKGLFE
jgi:hypothetical protein